MVTYIETFEIGNRTYGIEAMSGATDLYKCWVGGCAIGNYMGLPLARKRIHEYAVQNELANRSRATEELAKAEDTLAALGDDPFRLGRFLVLS